LACRVASIARLWPFLCARALGNERVLLLFTPENDSSFRQPPAGPYGVRISWRLLRQGRDQAPILNAMGCYERPRMNFIRTVVAEYGEGCKCKIVLPSLMDASQYPIFSVVVQFPTGENENGTSHCQSLPGHCCCHESQAAHTQDGRILLRRPASVRSRRDSQSSGVRSGFLRQEWGRCGRPKSPSQHLYKSQVYQFGLRTWVFQRKIQPPGAHDRTHTPLSKTQERVLLLPAPRQKWISVLLRERTRRIPAADLAPGCLDYRKKQVERPV